MIITTTNQIQGYEIKEYYGLVIASQVAGTNFFCEFKAGISDFFGGTSGTYRNQLGELFNNIKTTLEEDASGKGANAILGFSIDFDEISGKNTSMFMVTATGTAVHIVKNKQSRFNYYKQLKELRDLLKEGIITEKQYNYENMLLKEENPDSEIEQETQSYFERKLKQEQKRKEKEKKKEEEKKAIMQWQEKHNSRIIPIEIRLHNITESDVSNAENPLITGNMDIDLVRLINAGKYEQAIKYYMIKTGLKFEEAKQYIIFICTGEK